MKCHGPVLLLCALLCLSSRSDAQTFDPGAYRDFLRTHGTITGAQLITEHPTPLLQRRAAVTHPAWLDSVRNRFLLTADELSLLGENGFVVTERVKQHSFGEALIDIWQKDLPVFVSSDAILHAVHMSYDNILMSLELTSLIPAVDAVLTDLSTTGLTTLQKRYASNPALESSLRDLDLYLTVARSLLAGGEMKALHTDLQPVVQEMLAMIDAETPQSWPLFSSTPRVMDFSQFTVRGHYTRVPELGRYFKTMIWLGRTEFMFSSPVQPGLPAQTPADIQRQTVDAFLVKEAMDLTPSRARLDSVDQVLTAIVGESDNIRLAHLQEMQNELGFADASGLLDPTMLAAFQQLLATKPFAGQRINSQILMSDAMSPEQLKPPSAFILLGQRFIIDSYVLGNVVYDKIIHDGSKVLRMLPSPLDALFALGNDAAGQLLQDELARWHHAPNLAALRYLIDSHDGEFWNASLYNAWLDAIRALNPPDAIEGLPPFMQTAAWWQQKMNTQLASWSQLRHDNLLYAKPSYSGGNTCSYPEGYVEPVPAMYAGLALFARAAAPVFGNSSSTAAIATFFTDMAGVMDTLGTIATKELAMQPLSDREIRFIQSMIYYRNMGCGEELGGWYNRLHYNCRMIDPDYVIADVHTAPTDEAGNPVGWVLHAGTGRVNMGFVTAPSQNGGATVYTGAFMSYHETVTTNFTRLTDEEWSTTVLKATPARPSWTNIYLADEHGARRSSGPILATIMTGDDPAPAAPGTPQLAAAWPNPFAATAGTMIAVTIPAGVHDVVTLDILDVNGRVVRHLLQEDLREGTYYTRWVQDVPPGMYQCRMMCGSVIRTTPLVVVTR